jgi:CheY-like chemotaxis protein
VRPLITRDEFAQLVKEALNNLYDPVYLQTHALGDILRVEPAPGETAGEAVRAVLRDAIQSLKPPPSIPVTRPEWMAYRVLSLHHLRSLTADQVCEELNISVASFYRRQREALAALTSLLWDRYQQTLPPAQAEEEGTTDDQARANTVNLAEVLPRKSIHVYDLLVGIEQTMLPLAQQRNVRLQIHAPQALPPVYGAPSILRQVILCALAEAMSQLREDTLKLAISHQGQEVLWTLSSRTPQALTQILETSSAISLCRDLLHVYGGRIWIATSPERGSMLCFAIPVAHLPTVLVIDDDQRAVELYRRYLRGYDVLGVRTAREAAETLAQLKPDLILLDVILPQGDGWTILQNLKANADTRDIPVIVCSIMGQPDLALAWGAIEVLPKPISPEKLLETVHRWLPLEDSGESAHPVAPANV